MNINTLSLELKERFINKSGNYCEFRTGDILEITRKLDNRSHTFKAICIAKHNNGISSSFTVLNHEAERMDRFEMTLFNYNPNLKIKKISSIKKFKKSKLYYLRHKFGKQARVQQIHTSK